MTKLEIIGLLALICNKEKTFTIAEALDDINQLFERNYKESDILKIVQSEDYKNTWITLFERNTDDLNLHELVIQEVCPEFLPPTIEIGKGEYIFTGEEEIELANRIRYFYENIS